MDDGQQQDPGPQPRWMILPANPSHPLYNEAHRETEWCAKAGCVPVSDSCVQEGRKVTHDAPLYDGIFTEKAFKILEADRDAQEHRAAAAERRVRELEARKPSAYAYRYHDCIRFNHGQMVNGNEPIASIPLFFGEEVPVVRDPVASSPTKEKTE